MKLNMVQNSFNFIEEKNDKNFSFLISWVGILMELRGFFVTNCMYQKKLSQVSQGFLHFEYLPNHCLSIELFQTFYLCSVFSL